MNRRQFTHGVMLAPVGAGVAAARSPEPTGSAIASVMDPLVRDGELPGYAAAVWRNGRLETAVGGVRALNGPAVQEDTLFRIASITKPVTAVAAMILVEEGRMALDEPIERVLPELADRKVLREISSPVRDVEPAARHITLRHLLVQTFGLGAIMEWPPSYPIQAALAEAGMSPGYDLPQIPARTYLDRLAGLPLAAQPGEAFIYNHGLDVAGLAIERASGQALGAFMAERIFEPLGMADTGFAFPEAERNRGATVYGPEPVDGVLAPLPGPSFTFETPVFVSGAGGLASTAVDYIRFGRMLAAGGVLEGRRVLSERSVAEMRTDQLTLAQRAGRHAAPILGSSMTWGLGCAVAMGGGALGLPAGAFGWNGGYGTTAFSDPATGAAGVLLTSRAMPSPEPTEPFIRFWRAAFA